MTIPTRTLVESATAATTDEVYLVTLTIEPSDLDPGVLTTPLRLVNNTTSISRFNSERMLWSLDYGTTMAGDSGQKWSASSPGVLAEDTLVKRQGRNSLSLTTNTTDEGVLSTRKSVREPSSTPSVTWGGDPFPRANPGPAHPVDLTGKTLTFWIRPEGPGVMSSTDGVRILLWSDAPYSSSAVKTWGSDDLTTKRWNSISVDIDTIQTNPGWDATKVEAIDLITNRGTTPSSTDKTFFDAIYMGTTSVYDPFPFSITLPEQSGDTQPTARIAVDAVDQIVLKTLLDMRHAPTVTVSVILASQPNTIESGPYRFIWRDMEFTDLQVSGNLELRDILSEPFPSTMFTPQNHPGLFS